MKFLSTIVALFLLNNIFAYEFLGEVILDNRYFLNEGTSYQDKIHSSFSYSPEIFHDEEDYIFEAKKNTPLASTNNSIYIYICIYAHTFTV